LQVTLTNIKETARQTQNQSQVAVLLVTKKQQATDCLYMRVI